MRFDWTLVSEVLVQLLPINSAWWIRYNPGFKLLREEAVLKTKGQVKHKNKTPLSEYF